VTLETSLASTQKATTFNMNDEETVVLNNTCHLLQLHKTCKID